MCVEIPARRRKLQLCDSNFVNFVFQMSSQDMFSKHMLITGCLKVPIKILLRNENEVQLHVKTVIYCDDLNVCNKQKINDRLVFLTLKIILKKAFAI